MAGTSWQLTALGTTGAETPVVVDSTVTLQFDADGQAGGNTGCNSFGGNYTVNGDSLTFSKIISTLVACADADVMNQEQQYLDALNGAERYAVDGDELTIWYDNGNSMLTFTAGAAPTPVPTTEGPTATPAIPATPLPTVTPEPTTDGNADPGDFPPGEATRINFGPGETSAAINGSIGERETDFYVLSAQEGQIMSVEITSPNNDVLLTVVGADGTPYKRYQNGPPSWTFTLPATQDYYIEAVSVGPATDYTLRVWIEPLNNGGSTERIEFAPGETSANRSGALAEGGTKEYILTANAGQTMHVQTVGYNAPVEFTVRGPDGGSWTGTAQGSEVYIYTAQFVLPSAGDYTVALQVPANYGATRYDVVFTIDGATGGSTNPNPVEPERIVFAPAQPLPSAVDCCPPVRGCSNVLTANEGQTMTIDATSDGTPLSMTIDDPAGFSMIPEMREVEGGYAIGAQYTLPAAGDYLVTLQKGDHTPSTNFTVTFTIQ
ncbi:MAG: META domain-containing protein [Caldilineaceae bacterium]